MDKAIKKTMETMMYRVYRTQLLNNCYHSQLAEDTDDAAMLIFCLELGQQWDQLKMRGWRNDECEPLTKKAFNSIMQQVRDSDYCCDHLDKLAPFVFAYFGVKVIVDERKRDHGDVRTTIPGGRAAYCSDVLYRLVRRFRTTKEVAYFWVLDGEPWE